MLRYLLSGTAHQLFGTHFPYGTLVVNMLGCLTIGFIAAVGEEKFLLGTNACLFLIIVFCGAFTTFSTFIFETAYLIKNEESLKAFVNVMASVALGFLTFRFSVRLGDML